MSPLWQHLLLGALICAPLVACAIVALRRQPDGGLSARERLAAAIDRARDAAVEQEVREWRRAAKRRAVNDRRVRRRLGLLP